MFLEEGAKVEGEALATKSPSLARWSLNDEEALDPKVLHRMRPEVQARRAKYIRYVAAVCGVCVLLGLAALLKMMLQ
jgi:hypothetical protein